MVSEIREKLKELSNDELLELLETVSGEVKRRNNLFNNSHVTPIDKDEIQKNLKAMFDLIIKQ